MARRFSRDNLARLIGNEGVSVYVIAEELRRGGWPGPDRATIGRYLSGKQEPKARSLAALADYFNITVDALFEGD